MTWMTTEATVRFREAVGGAMAASDSHSLLTGAAGEVFVRRPLEEKEERGVCSMLVEGEPVLLV